VPQIITGFAVVHQVGSALPDALPSVGKFTFVSSEAGVTVPTDGIDSVAGSIQLVFNGTVIGLVHRLLHLGGDLSRHDPRNQEDDRVDGNLFVVHDHSAQEISYPTIVTDSTTFVIPAENSNVIAVLTDPKIASPESPKIAFVPIAAVPGSPN
jgi:hypothetical protein